MLLQGGSNMSTHLGLAEINHDRKRLQLTVARQTPSYENWLSIIVVGSFVPLAIVRVLGESLGYLLSLIYAIGLLVGQFVWPAGPLWAGVRPSALQNGPDLHNICTCLKISLPSAKRTTPGGGSGAGAEIDCTAAVRLSCR